jgi:uncharacterized membrane protein
MTLSSFIISNTCKPKEPAGEPSSESGYFASLKSPVTGKYTTTNMHKAKWFLFAFLAIGVGLYPIAYFILDPMFGLLSTKSSALLSDRVYNIGFYTHIIFGGIALLSGWSQFSRKLRTRNLPLHRLLGKVYLVSVLLSASASIYIAFHATGGLVAVTGFLGLGLVWFFSTAKAYASIRKKQIQLHEKWMIYSYAACFAAVTLRLWLPLLTFLHAGDFVPAYRIVAWLCWVPNILFAMYLNSKTVKPLASSIITAFLLLLLPACKPAESAPAITAEYRDLVALFNDWRAFENPPLREGAPDYTAATFKKRRPGMVKALSTAAMVACSIQMPYPHLRPRA